MVAFRGLLAVCSLLLIFLFSCDGSWVPRPEARAVALARPQLEERDAIGAAEVILSALQASRFCSSLIGLHDVTQTVTVTGPDSQTTTTEPGIACSTVSSLPN